MKAPEDIINIMYRKGRESDMKEQEHKKFGLEFIEAERDYNKALSMKMLALKAEGHAISTCEKLAKGDPLIADLKFEMDKRDILRDSCKKLMANIYTQIDILRSDLSFQKEDYRRISSTQQS